jgi:organic hydroperoxide reductase OsmC/OhrA
MRAAEGWMRGRPLMPNSCQSANRNSPGFLYSPKMSQHHYSVAVVWTGNTGRGTHSYTEYERAYQIRSGDKPAISGSSDPAFRGDPTRYNPEELFVAALSSCHMLWYLHLCADSGIVVISYEDNAEGTMIETAEGGRFTNVTLHPTVKVTHSADRAQALHKVAHERCFLANSVNFPVEHRPETMTDS